MDEKQIIHDPRPYCGRLMAPVCGMWPSCDTIGTCAYDGRKVFSDDSDIADTTEDGQ
jgi:hypothetical protein